MRARRLCLFLVGILIFVGTGVSAKQAAVSTAQAQKIARGARVSCASRQPCSASVGMVSSADGNLASQCTGSLVASDIVLTNAHCLPVALRQAGAACRGQVFMNFAPAKGDETQIDCREILVSSTGENNDTKPDYAFFRLASKSRRPVLTVSRQGIDDAQTFGVIKIDPVTAPGQLRGVQTRTTCTAHMNAYYEKVYSSPSAVNAQFGDCRIVHGNSGAPVVTHDGGVRGVIYGFCDPETYIKFFEERLIRFAPEAKLSVISMATNFACMDVPEDLGLASKDVDLCTNPPENRSRRALRDDLAFEMKAIFSDWREKHREARALRWKLQLSKSEAGFAPECLASDDASATFASLSVPRFKRVVQLDGDSRYLNVQVFPLEAPSHVSLQRVGAKSVVQVDDETLSLAPCE